MDSPLEEDGFRTVGPAPLQELSELVAGTRQVKPEQSEGQAREDGWLAPASPWPFRLRQERKSEASSFSGNLTPDQRGFRSPSRLGAVLSERSISSLLP